MINRSVKKIFALIITLLVAAGFYLFTENTSFEVVDTKDLLCATQSTEYIPGLNVSDDGDFKKGKTAITPHENKGICYNGVLLPYDEDSNTLYLSQTIKDDIWHGTLTSQIIGGSLYTLVDDNWSDKLAAIREGYIFTIWLTTGLTYYEYNLCVTGMPVVWINGSAGSKSPMVVFDPDERKITEVSISYRKKGNTSLTFPKKSYAIKIKNQNGEENAISLLGMREGDSWKLNSLYYDAERIREMVACQLWQEMDDANPDIIEPGPKMRYVELVKGDSYDGLYALVEPVDEDKLGLDDNDVLYKTTSWIIPTNAEIEEAIICKNEEASAVEIKYLNCDDYEAAWKPMYDYNSWVYENEKVTYADVAQRVNLENLYDYNIFIMAVDAFDNTYKNMYFAARIDADGNSSMQMIPWDLDISFQNAESYTDYRKILQVDSLTRLMELNPSQVKTDYANRYFSYRDNVLSTEHIIELIEENRDYLLDTGAFNREKELWPVCTFTDLTTNSNLEELENYQALRMEWLDSYYTDMLQEAEE